MRSWASAASVQGHGMGERLAVSCSAAAWDAGYPRARPRRRRRARLPRGRLLRASAVVDLVVHLRRRLLGTVLPDQDVLDRRLHQEADLRALEGCRARIDG